MRERKDVLAKWLTLEVGKPLKEAIGEVGGGALTGFGSERYISLENDLGSGYISKNIVPPVQSPTDQTQTAEQSTMFSDATNIDNLINNHSGN